MSRLTERLAALDRRVIGTPGDSKTEYADEYLKWWKVSEPRSRWAALIGYALVVAVATGLPYLAFGYPANKGVVVVIGVTYWPLIWHFYLRHRRRPDI